MCIRKGPLYMAFLCAAVLLGAVLPVDVSNAHHCKGKHASDPGCDSGGGGGGDPVADPAFAYVIPANGSAKIALANADGSVVTEVFVGTRFSIAMEPAVFGNASGGQILIGDFHNLHHITYSVDTGVISVDSDIMIHNRDLGPSSLWARPDWSPSGADFVFRDCCDSSMYIDSRATYANGYVTDFGEPLYRENRFDSTSKGPDRIAWDAPDTIYFNLDTDDGWELRRMDITQSYDIATNKVITVCGPSNDTTCDSTTTTCVASNTASDDCADAVLIYGVFGVESFEHVSVSATTCAGGSVPPLLVSGYIADGSPITYVLEGPIISSTMFNFSGNDWTPNCTIVGSPGDDTGGPIQGGAIVEVDPYSIITTTLIKRKGQTPDWIN